jgi:hypothetical protein
MRKQYSKQTALELFNQGYRQTSRNYGIVSRVDITDEEMIQKHISDNFGDKESGVPSCDIESQRDFYRRVHSKDTIEDVPISIIKELNRLVRDYKYKQYF